MSLIKRWICHLKSHPFPTRTVPMIDAETPFIDAPDVEVEFCSHCGTKLRTTFTDNAGSEIYQP